MKSLSKANSNSSWSHNRAPESDTPALNNFIKRVLVEGQDVEVVIWDNSGMDNYERLRRLSYEDVHVILICFDISEPDSLENVQYMVCCAINGNTTNSY
jgi:GTPase SAR1 family protein